MLHSCKAGTAPVGMPHRTLFDFAVALVDTLAGLPLTTNVEEVYATAPSFSLNWLVEGKEITTSGFVSATKDVSTAMASLKLNGEGDGGIVIVISTPRSARSRASRHASERRRATAASASCPR